jgi:hypothetical protein
MLSAGTLAPLSLVTQPQLFSFSAQGVAVDSQRLGCLGPVSVVLFENPLDESLLEFPNGLRELNSVFNHAVDEGF